MSASTLGNSRRFSRLRALAAMAVFVALAAAATADEIRVGVLSSSDTCANTLSSIPTVEHLNGAVPGHTFTLFSRCYDELVAAVIRGELDFVIADPAFCAQLEARQGLKVIATAQNRFGNARYDLSAGALLCLRDRKDLRTARLLRGGRISTANRRLLGDWLAVEREFRAAGISVAHEFESVTVTGDPESAVLDVIAGRADAASVPAGTLERMEAEKKIEPGKLRALGFEHVGPETPANSLPVASSTRVYPARAFAACRNTSPELIKAVAAALLTMPPPPAAAPGAPASDGWTAPHSDLAVHQCLQDLRLHPYEDFGRISITDLVRQHMYWFLAVGAVFILLVVIDVYVTVLNRTLAAEIVERKRAEVALRESIRRFETIAACSADWIWETDLKGNYTYSSSIVQQMIGYNPAELIGTHHFELFATAEKERLRAEGVVTLSSGKKVFRERYRIRTKDGRVVIHEMTAEPIHNGNGELVGYRGVNRDITDQVRFVRLRV